MEPTNPLLIPYYGFDVWILDPAYISVGREQVPAFDERKLRTEVVNRLVVAPGRFTGAHVRFARHSLGLTLAELARELGVTHPAVVRWEKLRDAPTRMNRCSEIVLRQLLNERFGKSAIPAATIRAAVDDAAQIGRIEVPQTEIAMRSEPVSFQEVPDTLSRPPQNMR